MLRIGQKEARCNFFTELMLQTTSANIVKK